MKRYRTPASNRTIAFCIVFPLVIVLLVLVGLPLSARDRPSVQIGFTGRPL